MGGDTLVDDICGSCASQGWLCMVKCRVLCKVLINEPIENQTRDASVNHLYAGFDSVCKTAKYSVGYGYI